MTATIEAITKKFSLMIKDQRGYTPEQFEAILNELVEEILKDANRTGL